MQVIREFDPLVDARLLSELDTSFSSDFVYVAEAGAESLQLRLLPSQSQIQKRFPIDLREPVWDRGYVAIEGSQIRGFIATRYEAWNRRLVIAHFYVDREHRRRGIGRKLIEHAIEMGRISGAVVAWVETSNHNHPGILAYQSLGFSLCGFDLTLYQGTASETEFAIYLARPVGGSA
jgi:ribosomal protein S18 acetylase RimI-like enzyme